MQQHNNKQTNTFHTLSRESFKYLHLEDTRDNSSMDVVDLLAHLLLHLRLQLVHRQTQTHHSSQ